MTRTSHPRAVAVKQIAAKSLESYAAKALDLDAVFAGITKAAAEGFYLYRHAVDRPVKLQEANATKALCARLTEEGFGIEWVARMVPARESACGVDVVTFDLLVRWSS
ncbi:MAG: hypothetical protein O9333_13685 [Beijerinckiaceae bacterium]|nr:hypothetical protein [Beijerinckiaceae bacterium]